MKREQAVFSAVAWPGVAGSRARLASPSSFSRTSAPPIDLAKEVRAARKRGEDEGLSEDEVAFHDALAGNDSAVEAMGNDPLKVVAHEYPASLKGSVSVNWSHRESSRAHMRVLVKRIVREHG